MGWPEHYDAPFDGSSYTSPSSAPTSSPLPPQPLEDIPELIIIDSIDDDGDIVIEIADGNIYNSATTTTIASGSALPTANLTRDPHSILSHTSTTTSPQPSQTAASRTIQSTNSPTQDAALNSASSSSVNQAKVEEDDHHGGPPPIGAMVVVPIAIIAICIVAFVFWRKRSAARRNGLVSQEMKMRSPEEGLSRGPPGYESTSGLLMTPAVAATPRTRPMASNSSRTNRASQPVILNTSMGGGAYFTGIDTSDAVSMASGAASHPESSRRSFDVNSTASDEPPPPYRPASVPSISRETSLRNPNQNLTVNTGLAAVSEGNVSRQRGDDDDDDLTPTAETTPMRNPFDDPDDDAVSVMSTPMQRPQGRRQDGDEDSRSMISEFSFENEHR